MALGLLLVAAACTDSAVGPTATESAALGAMAGAHGPGKLHGEFINPQGNGRSCDPTEAADDGTGSPLQSAEWIDRKGGMVLIHGTSSEGQQIAHVLSVPRNAVRERTLFCMRLHNNSHMQVSLKAMSVERHRGVTTVENVGRAGFREPVQLYMSYHQARVMEFDGEGRPVLVPLTVEEAQRLYVAYEPDGTTTPTDRMPTVNLSSWDKYIVATLPHFSKYVMMLD